MKENNFLNAYTRYSETLKNCTDEKLPQHFQLMYNWINEHSTTDVDDDLVVNVLFASIETTIEEIEERKINLFNLSKHWNTTTVTKAKRIIDSLVENEHANMLNTLVDKTKEKVLAISFVRLIRAEVDPCLKLYLYTMYRNFFKSCFTFATKNVKKWCTNGYMPSIVKEFRNEKEDYNGFNAEELDALIAWEKQYNKVNPKTKVELVEQFTQLSQQYADGNISNKLFKFINDHIIKPRMHYYSQGGLHGFTTIEDSKNYKLLLQGKLPQETKAEQKYAEHLKAIAEGKNNKANHTINALEFEEAIKA